MNRRSFLRSAALLVAAPAIVRASSLMAISPVPKLTFQVVPIWYDAKVFLTPIPIKAMEELMATMDDISGMRGILAHA